MSRAAGPPPDYDLKIVMVGSIGVGKTSLVCRFVKDTFRDFLTTTIGASYMFKTETIQAKTVKFSLWDTAGQEQFHSLVPLYFRDADGVVMVVDGSRPGSVHEDVKIWIDKVRQAAPPTVSVVIATNKCDMPTADEARFNAEQLGQEYGFVNATVSAKTGDGVHDMYRSLAEACIAQRNSGGTRKPSTGPGGAKGSAGGKVVVEDPVEDDDDDDHGGRVGTVRRTQSKGKIKLSQPRNKKDPGGKQKKKSCPCG